MSFKFRAFQMNLVRTLLTVGTALTLPIASAQINLYQYGLNATAHISSGCTTALNSLLNCDPFLLSLSSSDFYGSLGNATLQSSVCSSACGTSLASYHNSVTQACSNDPQPWSGIPAVWAGDALWSVYNRTCLKDSSTGAYCADEISSWAANLTVDMSITSLPAAQLCSPCTLGLFQIIQGTSYSNYGPNLVDAWTAAQATCGVDYPTEVQPSVTNVTLPGFATTSSNVTCLSGNTYTVKSGDNCQAIAAAYNVATGTLKIINSLLPDCSNLLGEQVLCLPQTCNTYLVQSGDTCASIALANGLSITALIGYNPTFNSECTNLLSGTNICLSPAAGTYTPTTIPGAASTTAGSYATTTVPAPGPTAKGTTQNCGLYYKVQSGDICQQISLNSSITVATFEAINPSIDAACDNLVPGLWYCVLPVLDWNMTGPAAPSTTVAPPAPTPSGSSNSCYGWYTVQSGDYCSLILDSYGITSLEFQEWNPSINSNCTNLIPDDAYCVNGPLTNSTTTTPSSPTSISDSSTSSSTTTSASGSQSPGSCHKTYTVQSGDTCYAIWTANDITETQLMAWNPSLDSNCDLQVGQVLCVSE